MNLKRLFCDHKYQYLGKWNCTFKFEDGITVNVPVTFLECNECGKRRALREKSPYYNAEILNYIKLWEKGQLELGFEDE